MWWSKIIFDALFSKIRDRFANKHFRFFLELLVFSIFHRENVKSESHTTLNWQFSSFWVYLTTIFWFVAKFKNMFSSLIKSCSFIFGVRSDFWAFNHSTIIYEQYDLFISTIIYEQPSKSNQRFSKFLEKISFSCLWP